MRSKPHTAAAIALQAALITVALTLGLHAQQPAGDAKGSPPSNRPSPVRSSPEALKRELEALNAQINDLAGKIDIGRQTIETWQKTYRQIQDILNSQAQQEAACLKSKNDLQEVERREDTPERYLRESRRHVRECDEAASRHRHHAESLAAEVLQSRPQINGIDTEIRLHGSSHEAMLQRKRVIEQLIQFNSDNVTRMINRYNENRVGF